MEAAHAANEAKSQILANTSHELRTPIGAIVGALSALEDTDYNLTGEQRDMVKIMQITSDVALSVINDLLDTAKLEAGAMSLNIKECPALTETLEQSVRIFGDKAGRKEVDLIMEPSEDLERLETLLQQGMSIWTDGDRLQQVIMNLIGNAVKFTTNGKVMIHFSVAKNASSMTPTTFHFEVTDTGIGIDPDFLKNNIFKSFAQVDQSMTRRFGGTGLGLAISKHLVMMNGGILGVTSNIGQGSTFYFTWPVALVSVSTKPRPARSLAVNPVIPAELALETRAVVVEPVTESRQQLGWILSHQGVQVTLYENFDTVVQDEQARNPHLLGVDGTVLAANHRPNAHFFLCTRSNTVDATTEPSSPSNLPGLSTFSAASTTTGSPLSSSSSAHFEGHAAPLASTLAAALGASTYSPTMQPTVSSGSRPPKIDLILMDCAMPVKSGFEAASEIRAIGQASSFAAQIPIIALTASAVPSTKEKCLAAGMNGYLSKPTKLADLEAMLDQWID
ncbi:histidine kinase-like ATPase [Linnemannia elongata]|nr:histidine kinase-like ATPase [Linnemannia elongata]